MSAAGRSGASIFAAPSPGLCPRRPDPANEGARRFPTWSLLGAQLRLHPRERARGRHGPRPRRPPGLPGPPGPARPRAVRTRGGRPFPAERAPRRRSASSRRRPCAQSSPPSPPPPHHVPHPRLRHRETRSRPPWIEPARPRAQAAGPECRPEARRVHDTLAAVVPRLPAACGALGAFVRLRTRPGLAGIRPVARGTRERRRRACWRPPLERCSPSATGSRPSHQRHSNILRV
ncbi:cleavage and polyadenylation specificity factor subunit 6-like [Cricetulus griseus]|uniref:Cleavage and polyadenylation specificity factor subunit 6-like n=1 Tax=Cricetulus griseus TaxID=10029 RepID=A0A9J7G515_CRIGR|nr:cleavage and polyadenylation specificity factor subunit 6-like [Cricetulus griseus]